MKLSNLEIAHASCELGLPDRYANVSVKTIKAARLFLSFCKLEKKVVAQSNRPRPQFLKWILKQEARYYNRFTTLFVEEMYDGNQSSEYSKTPTPMFLELRRETQKMEESSTSSKDDDSIAN